MKVPFVQGLVEAEPGELPAGEGRLPALLQFFPEARLHPLEAPVDALQGAVFGQEGSGGFVADALYAGDVVHAVAHHGQVVGHGGGVEAVVAAEALGVPEAELADALDGPHHLKVFAQDLRISLSAVRTTTR